MWWFFILEIKPDNAHDFRLHLDQIYEFIHPRSWLQYCSKLICLHNTNLNLVSEKEKKIKNSCTLLRFDIFLQQFKKSMMLEKDPIVVFNNVTVGWSIFPTRGFYQRKLRVCMLISTEICIGFFFSEEELLPHKWACVEYDWSVLLL